MNSRVIDLPQPLAFDWDKGNSEKNEKHNVKRNECEEVFFGRMLVVYDEEHSKKEKRYQVYGQTFNGRRLLIVFTIRKDTIRVISARDQDKKERSLYERYIAETI